MLQNVNTCVHTVFHVERGWGRGISRVKQLSAFPAYLPVLNKFIFAEITKVSFSFQGFLQKILVSFFKVFVFAFFANHSEVVASIRFTALLYHHSFESKF